MREACLECHESDRLFICGRCREQVRICSRCDHGNIYCKDCSPLQRLESTQRAGAVYQRTPKGRMNHADRQARYRERLAEKVTHQGYLDASAAPKDDGKQALIATVETTVEATTDLDQGVRELGSEGSQPSNEEPNTATTSVPEDVLGLLAPQREVYREYRCDFCGRRCGVYSRLGFIRRR